MKAISKVAFAAASLFAASTVLGQTKPMMPAMTMMIGNATVGDTQANADDRWAELLRKYSDGRLKVSVHHGGSLGSYAQMLPALQAGSVHAIMLPAGFLSSFVPEISLFDLPFLLPGAPANITAFAAQSKAAAKMMELAGLKGIHIIGFHGIGAQSFLTKFPVNKLADIQGKKFRIIPSPARVGTYQNWGAVARPMEIPEVYTALQQGTLDGLDNPPDVLYKMKLHEVAKYFTITEHTAFVSALTVSKKWFDALPKDLQGVVIKTGKDIMAWCDGEYTKSQTASLEAMRKVITVTHMPAAEIQKMKDLTRKGVWETMRNDPQKGVVVKLLEEDLARFSKK